MSEIFISNGAVSARVDMLDGMNVVSLKYKEIEVVECDSAKKAAGRTYAIPILFPTPNRTRGDRYLFDGIEVQAVRHGFARKSAFEIIETSESSVTGKASYPKTEAFPYDINLIVKISALENKLMWNFTIENNGDNPFPFGLALHPFFKKELFNSVSSSLERAMLMDDNMLPTGITEIASYSEGVALDGLDVDCVFLSDSSVVSSLKGDELELKISGSDEFNHVVIYTGSNFSFVCVEPQTCSTDFVNLHNSGYEKEANMLVLPGGEKRKLFVEFTFS